MVTQIGTEPDRAKARRKQQGAMIRKLRQLHSLSIQEFAEQLNVTPGAVSQWENGRFTPRAQLQVAIARAFLVPHSAIFGLDQEVVA